MILYNNTKGINNFLSQIGIDAYSTIVDKELVKGFPIIRLGNSEYPQLEENFQVYNRISHMYELCNKKEYIPSIKKMYGINSISLISPKISENLKKITDIVYIGKTNTGKNKTLFDNYDDFTNHFNQHSIKGWYYYMQPNSTREYKAHCAHGKILLFYEKNIYSDSEKDAVLIKQTNYNSFVKPLKQCLDIIATLGLDFGIVDFSLYNDVLTITDVNVNPSFITRDIINKYSKYFTWLYCPERKQHFNYHAFNKGESLKWKNNQLVKPDVEDLIKDKKENKQVVNLNRFIKRKPDTRRLFATINPGTAGNMPIAGGEDVAFFRTNPAFDNPVEAELPDEDEIVIPEMPNERVPALPFTRVLQNGAVYRFESYDPILIRVDDILVSYDPVTNLYRRV